MDCIKFILTNTGNTSVNFNYQECSDSQWQYQVELKPNETKSIWLLENTYSTAFNSNIVKVEQVFPPVIPIYTIDGVGVYYYAADDSSTISGITGNIFANGVKLSKEIHIESNKEVAFTGGTIPYLGTAYTFTLVLSASPVGNYYFADDGVSGIYDKQILSAYTYVQSSGGNDIFTGITKFFSGNTMTDYSENGEIFFNHLNKHVFISGVWDTGYFNILPG